MTASAVAPVLETATSEEVVQLSAVDPIFYEHEFFPRAVRMTSPPFKRKVWDLCLERESRQVGIMMFRGSSKTTTLRIITSRCVAFGTHRTILYLGKSEDHAIRSVEWLRAQILYNTKWTSLFGLEKGDKFQGTEAAIRHRGLGHNIWLVAAGIEGSIRGINLEDHRPDLIILDDVVGDQNAATPDGRKKLNDLIFGALLDSLAAPGEAPDAKLIMLNTPMHKEDPSVLALSDRSWRSLRVGCWTPDSEDAELGQRQSVWPQMFPTRNLQEKKQQAAARGQTYLFNREMECRLTDPEKTVLRREWLQRWSSLPAREDISATILSIDPVPKPTPVQVAKNLHGKDWEVLQVWGRVGRRIVLLDRMRNRGHEPNWTRMAAFQLAFKWRPLYWVIDATAYQTTLSWILQEEMRRLGAYWRIEERTDRRSKFDKIVETFSGPGAEGLLIIPDWYTEFQEQWEQYPDVQHDDDLDAGHLAVSEFNKALLRETLDKVADSGLTEERYEPLPSAMWGAP